MDCTVLTDRSPVIKQEHNQGIFIQLEWTAHNLIAQCDSHKSVMDHTRSENSVTHSHKSIEDHTRSENSVTHSHKFIEDHTRSENTV